MDKFLIRGPCKVKGTVNISGSKNASLPILAASILFDEMVENLSLKAQMEELEKINS